MPSQTPEETVLRDAIEELIAQKAREVKQQAENIQPHVTELLQEETAAIGGMLKDLEHKLKSEESIARKIRTNLDIYPEWSLSNASEAVYDGLRYTAVFEDSQYANGCLALLKSLGRKGFEVIRRINYWGPQWKARPYRGINTVLQTPDGQSFELQFHTERSCEIKQRVHPLYERARESNDPSEMSDLEAWMMKEWRGVPVPPRVEEVKDMGG